MKEIKKENVKDLGSSLYLGVQKLFWGPFHSANTDSPGPEDQVL